MFRYIYLCDADYLFISVSKDSAYISDEPFPEDMPQSEDNQNIQTETPKKPTSFLSIQLSISTNPLLNQTGDIIATLSSSIDSNNIYAEIVSAEGLSSINGELKWKGKISKNTNIKFITTIKAMEKFHLIMMKI